MRLRLPSVSVAWVVVGAVVGFAMGVWATREPIDPCVVAGLLSRGYTPIPPKTPLTVIRALRDRMRTKTDRERQLDDIFAHVNDDIRQERARHEWMVYRSCRDRGRF